MTVANVFGIVIRTSALLVCVSLLAIALRRTSASVRHALWAVGLLAVLVFPVVSRWIPEWNLAILPESSRLTAVFDTTPATPAVPDVPRFSARPEVRQPRQTAAPSAAATQLHVSAHTEATQWTAGQWLPILWGLGSAVFLIGCLKSVWDLQRLTQRSLPLTDEGLRERLSETQKEIGVPGTVQLRISTAAISPMTWGIVRKVILLPIAALDWSPIRQRLVLAHELAHVKRNDSVGQLLAQTVTTMYWFNPLVWYAMRRMHAERERSCDDCVLRLGATGEDYADHLLQVTRGLNDGFTQSAVSMAHSSQLKSRLIAILDSGLNRSKASRSVATTLLTTIGVLTLSIAAIQLTALSTLVLPAFAAPLGAPLWSPQPKLPPTPVAVQQPPAAAVVDPQRAFINQYCVSCHNPSDQVGYLILDASNADLAHVANNRELWEKIVKRLRAGMDPPPFASVARPSAATINSMIQYLESELDRNAKTYVPRIGPHRLNRTEYTNAIRDLLDLEFDSTQLLPGDDSTAGFDNIVGALDSPRTRDVYAGVAPVISRLAIQTATNSPSHQRIFVCNPEAERLLAPNDPSPRCYRRILSTLTENAYRGSATAADIDDIVGTFTAGLKNSGFDSAIETALAKILANPKFLYRSEDAPSEAKSGDAFRISDVALASRLSFFLWSTSPDQELIDLATQGKLHEPVVLEEQTMRMLKDYRADTLTTNFAGQWLWLRGLKYVAPVPTLFPEFDDGLRQAMRREGELFFDSIVREDRNVVDLLTANYTFVNNRLARLYGIPNITGNQFRRITLTDAFDARRGILGKAAFLSVTSRENRTSPVTRGKFAMNILLGVSPPDPAPNDPPLINRWTDPAVVAPSVRTAMEELVASVGNRYKSSCITCHQLVDPIGNALESFNAIGMWRTTDGGAPVNAADTLYDGTKVDGPADLRRWLVGHSDQFVQVLTQKLMTYALGRRIEPQDMPLIRSIARDANRNNNRFSAIVLGIVKSDAFQMNSK